MKRKITDLAFARSGECGGLGANGFRVSARAFSACKSAPKAKLPNPQKASVRNSRRFRVGLSCSLYIEKVICCKQRQRELAHGIIFQKSERSLAFFEDGFSPEHKI